MISEQLKAELRIIRETALQLRDEIKSRALQQMLDFAVQDLDAFPRMFASDEYARSALFLPNWRIRYVAQAVQRFGPNVEVIPDDYRPTGG